MRTARRSDNDVLPLVNWSRIAIGIATEHLHFHQNRTFPGKRRRRDLTLCSGLKRKSGSRDIDGNRVTLAHGKPAGSPAYKVCVDGIILSVDPQRGAAGAIKAHGRTALLFVCFHRAATLAVTHRRAARFLSAWHRLAKRSV